MAKSRKKTQFAIKFSSSWPELWWLLAWKKKKKLSSSKVFVMWSGFCRKSAYQIQQLEYQFQCLGGLLKEWDQFSLCLSAAIGVSARFFQALSLAKFHVIGWLRWFLPVSVRAMAGWHGRAGFCQMWLEQKVQPLVVWVVASLVLQVIPFREVVDWHLSDTSELMPCTLLSINYLPWEQGWPPFYYLNHHLFLNFSNSGPVSLYFKPHPQQSPSLHKQVFKWFPSLLRSFLCLPRC